MSHYLLRFCRWTLLCLVGLLALEASLRLHDWLRLGLPFFWDPVRTSQDRPCVSNAFLVTRPQVNDWHTRGKPPGQAIDPSQRSNTRVICLGGSTTWDEAGLNEFGISYPAELQRVLDGPDIGVGEPVTLGPPSLEVINAGFPDFTTLHSLVLLETELLDLKPTVLILQGNMDDLVVNYFPDADRPAYGAKLLHRTELPRELQRPPHHGVLDHSRLYQCLREGLRREEWYRLKFRAEDAAPMVLTQKESYRRHLQSLLAIAKAHGVRVVFVPQAVAPDPALFEKHFKRKPYTMDVVYPRLGEFIRHVDEYNQVMKEVAMAYGASFADLSALRDRPELFVDFVHLKPEGTRLLVKEVADWVFPEGRLGRRFAF